MALSQRRETATLSLSNDAAAVFIDIDQDRKALSPLGLCSGMQVVAKLPLSTCETPCDQVSYSLTIPTLTVPLPQWICMLTVSGFPIR